MSSATATESLSDLGRTRDDAAAGGGVSATATVPAPKPFDAEFVTISKREHIELRLQASSYKSLHARAVDRIQRTQALLERELLVCRHEIARLEGELVLARAQNRDLRQRVFGAKTEQSRSVNALQTTVQEVPAPARRPRGQQRGSRGHGRRRLPALPAAVEDQPGSVSCPQCGLAAKPAWGSEDSEVLEIEVKAYRRVVRRPRYRPACQCGCLPGLVTPSRAQGLWPRNKLGTTIWTELLLSKYLYGQPTARLLQDWRERGLTIAQGSVTGGMQRLGPLFAPILDECLNQVRSASHWHADETRWEVFEEMPGKVGHRWYLWVFKAAKAVCFVMDPSRSAAVPTRTLEGVNEGILSVDRYAAYRKFAKRSPGMSLSLCWAHQRRDFLRVANDHPALWNWSVQWVQRIGELYALHSCRRAVMADTSATAYLEATAKLRDHVEVLRLQCEVELADAELGAPARKVLRVMQSYWPGLTVFVDHPWLDLDNNSAERALRPAVVGRKNYYGSGSQWSGQLAATMMSVLGTMRLWQVNPRTWLLSYLQACAQAGGHPPHDIDGFIPWRMTQAQLAVMRQAMPAATITPTRRDSP